MRRCLGLVAVVYALSGLALVDSQGIETVPKSALYAKSLEKNVDFLCRSDKPIESCRVLVPGFFEEYDISELPPELTYIGESLPRGECGVRLDVFRSANEGKFRCSLTVGGEVHEATIQVFMANPPLPTALKFSRQTLLAHGGLQPNQTLRAKCVSSDGLPASNLTWYLGDEPIVDAAALKPPRVIDGSQDSRGRTLQTIEQEVNLYITSKDDGKKLSCVAQHFAITRTGEFRTTLPLNIVYPPEPVPQINIGELPESGSASVNVTIKANPRPTITWTINGQTIGEGESVGVYQAYSPQTLQNSQYLLLLRIRDCSEERPALLKLEATNEFGTQTYVIKTTKLDTELNEVQVSGKSGAVFWLISVWTFFCSVIATRLL